MAPGIRKGDVMLVDRRSGARESATVGDVVLFAPPPALVDAATRAAGVAPGRGDFFVKRIVAVEGDRIEIVDGALIRNGRRERPYPTGTPVGVVTSEEEDARERRRSDALTVCGSTCKPGRYDLAPTTVPRGVVLVLGDNRGASNDGHVWGYLPREYVLGKTAVRVGPWGRGGALETEARAPPRE
jgi:signal peptidase I